jgi:GNAT superfamily N-acetyltransferase
MTTARPAVQTRAVQTRAVRIRQAGQDDRDDLAEMYERCSLETRYRRFHGFSRTIPEPYLTAALADRPGHLALVAETPTRIVALASCADGELGVLVEDAYQRQGIGTRLLETLIEHSGCAAMRAVVLADQTWIVPLLSRYSQIKTEMS